MRKIKTNILVVLIVIIHHCAYGQIIVENKEIRLTQIIEQAVFTDTSYIYSDMTILVDDLDADLNTILGLGSPLDSKRFDNYKNGYSDLDKKSKDKIAFDTLGRVIINSDLTFLNCKIKQNRDQYYIYPLMSGFVFKGLKVDGLEAISFSISGSVFTECLVVESSIENLSIINCEFDGGLKLILNKAQTNLDLADLKFKIFEPEGISFGGFSAIDSKCVGLTINSVFEQNKIEIDDSFVLFNSEGYRQELSLSVPKINDFYLRNNSISCPVKFNDLIVENRLVIDKNSFLSKISMENFIFPDKVNHLFWKQFEGRKISIDEPNDSVLVRDEEKFKSLIRQYKKMHSIFLINGDIESANGCYVEMKELETLRMAAMYNDSGGYYNFLKLSLNRLMKTYANYGTDPILALLMSTYVLLLFSILYSFFPSEWDNLNRTELLAKMRNTNIPITSRIFKFVTSISIHFINSFALSLNSFVTLGFGSIPTTGFPRYLCIIEGCIGWFLLSIFSVSLLNQLMI